MPGACLMVLHHLAELHGSRLYKVLSIVLYTGERGSSIGKLTR